MRIEGVDLYGVGVDIVDVWAESLEELLVVVEDSVASCCLGVLLGCVWGSALGWGWGSGSHLVLWIVSVPYSVGRGVSWRTH